MTKSQRKKFIKNAFSTTEVSVLLEDIYDEIKVIGEGHKSLNKKIDDFRNETKANFKAINEFLSRIDDEYMTLRKKVNFFELGRIKYRDFEWIKNKVLDIEKQLKEFKKQQTALAAKI